MKITKFQLVKKLAERGRMQQCVSFDIINILFDIIHKEIAQGNQIVLPTLGTLKTIEHKAKRRGNVKREVCITPPSLHIKLIPSLFLRNSMKKLFTLIQMERTDLFK